MPAKVSLWEGCLEYSAPTYDVSYEGDVWMPFFLDIKF